MIEKHSEGCLRVVFYNTNNSYFDKEERAYGFLLLNLNLNARKVAHFFGHVSRVAYKMVGYKKNACIGTNLCMNKKTKFHVVLINF